MHMADALISPAVGGAMWIVTVGLIAYCARKLKQTMNDNIVPMMGVLGAFIFAAQMINFSIPGTGSSGHLGGALILSILLGPYAAFIVIASVLTVQAFFFADGGLLALGANIFKMGIIASFSSYLRYRLVIKFLGDGRRSQLIGGFTGAWVSVFLASVFCAVELAVSGASPMAVVLPAMAGVHALIGIGEGLITGAALGLVLATRADLLQLQKI